MLVDYLLKSILPVYSKTSISCSVWKNSIYCKKLLNSDVQNFWTILKLSVCHLYKYETPLNSWQLPSSRPFAQYELLIMLLWNHFCIVLTVVVLRYFPNLLRKTSFEIKASQLTDFMTSTASPSVSTVTTE